MSCQVTTDELQAKVSALLNIEKVLKFLVVSIWDDSNLLVRIFVQVSSSYRPWKRKRIRW